MARKDKTPWVIGVVAGILAAGLVYYKRAGAGSEKNAILIPDSLEARFDMVVDALNKKFDRRWINYGLDMLEAGLVGLVPKSLLGLVSFVVQAERIGLQRELTGRAKRDHAVTLYNSARKTKQ